MKRTMLAGRSFTCLLFAFALTVGAIAQSLTGQ